MTTCPPDPVPLSDATPWRAAVRSVALLVVVALAVNSASADLRPATCDRHGHARIVGVSELELARLAPLKRRVTEVPAIAARSAPDRGSLAPASAVLPDERMFTPARRLRESLLALPPPAR